MSDFRFAHGSWAYALWLVIALMMLLFWLEWRRSDALARFVSSLMQPRLVRRQSRLRRMLSIVLLGLAAVALIVALMRPQWGLSYQKTPRVGAQIMVCLDVSKSMLAEDTAPNRLERAKAEVSDLLSFLPGDQVGLIAFAGRATVLCPLTPDFGFFKMILDGAGPDSVGRGGTRLEEPIRKALVGFRNESDVSRVILLITDGEDHDSHPLDAAQFAAERGIKIITIGFGDEAGSRIEFTDPTTGTRDTVRDSNGAPVLSQLDGETLREIALATEGAYIPAGTGALDLQSIHAAHIRPLVRGTLDDRGHAVRHEGFRWAILVGLSLLLAAVGVGSSSVNTELRTAASPVLGPGASLATFVAFVTLGGFAASAQAQPATTATHQSPAEATSAAPQETSESSPSPTTVTQPRDAYNEGLALLDTDLEGAERWLNVARRDAGTDGEVRFRATYNMGWVEVKRADGVLQEQPTEALTHLRRAADWFRDAVRIRPDQVIARRNLEVVMRRILELSDSLAKTEPQDLTQRLDALIEAQRGLTGTVRELVQRVADAGDADDASSRFRTDFRKVAVEQRKLLSDAQALSLTGREEKDALESKAAEERSPKESLRLARLSNLLHYANQATQRLGQARSQMRRQQAERAFRRAAAGLTELKRARDQLREPVAILDVILADAMRVEQWTNAQAASEMTLSAPRETTASLPAWLTPEYLQETQLALTERTGELSALLTTALEQHVANQDGPQPAENAVNPLLDQLREAAPLLKAGHAAFLAADQQLASKDYSAAVDQQRQAILSLRSARERFLDLRRLIELTYQVESGLANMLALPTNPNDATETEENTDPADTDDTSGSDEPAATAEIPVPLLLAASEVQGNNRERMERIGTMLAQQLAAATAQAENAANSPAAQDPSGQDPTGQRDQLAAAQPLVKAAQKAMDAALTALQKTVPVPPASSEEPSADQASPVDVETLNTARTQVDQAVTSLQALRRLFFSIVEHLRETAQRQAQLNDETEQLAGLREKEDTGPRTGPISLEQEELRTISSQLAQGLAELAKSPPPSSAPNPQQPNPQQMQQIAQQYNDAAKLVEEAGDRMKQVTESLSADVPRLPDARAQQDDALQKLAEAISLLAPPPQQPQQDQQQQDQPQEGEQQSEENNPQQQQQPSSAGVDPARLLQAVRDREAQRRRMRERRGQAQREPVAKDW